MKKILITGANSYIGTSFERYISENYPEQYTIDTVDMTHERWNTTSFVGYDCVFHVAGIAHQKETSQNAYLYYGVNRDLTIETAKKAKEAGVKQFIFLSSMSVYGKTTGIITPATEPVPRSHYGKSKLQAEDELKKLEDDFFIICMIRPPMVYGYQSKGNFSSVVRLVQKSPVFPLINNKRSVIYIDNLCEFVRLAIMKKLKGTYFPQNREYANTSGMAKSIADAMGKKLIMSSAAGAMIQVIKPFYTTAQKAFGTLVYEGLEVFDHCYCVVDLRESYKKSVSPNRP